MAFYTNIKDGYFTDAIIGLAPGETSEIETGKETQKVDMAWKGGWLAKSQNAPENAVLVPVLAEKKAVKIEAKPKTVVK
jgi:hypothetical protein